HAVQPAVDAAVSRANHGFAIAEHFAERTVVEAGIPRHGDARAEAAIERIVGIFQAAADITNGGETEDRLIHLTGQGRLLALIKIIGGDNKLVIGIHQTHLLAVQLVRRHFETVAHAISQRDARLEVPGVAAVYGVSGDDALIESGGANWPKLQVRS